MISATLCFVLGHFILSARPIRDYLIETLKRNGFLGVYSIFAATSFIWMNLAYARAPFEDLWGDPTWVRWLGIIVMPLATVLLATGAMTANPAALGFGDLLEQGRKPTGVQKITRHPVQWAIAIWAGIHFLANGDMASAIFFGGFLTLSILGMVHMECRKRAENDALWTRFTDQSSFFPFGAIMAGRVKTSLKEIGLNRIAVGIILYLVLLFGHRIAIDVPLLPQLSGI
ncbi:MAG: NnrU family protein [Alphaproteobacteria bacterium]